MTVNKNCADGLVIFPSLGQLEVGPIQSALFAVVKVTALMFQESTVQTRLRSTGRACFGRVTCVISAVKKKDQFINRAKFHTKSHLMLVTDNPTRFANRTHVAWPRIRSGLRNSAASKETLPTGRSRWRAWQQQKKSRPNATEHTCCPRARKAAGGPILRVYKSLLVLRLALPFYGPWKIWF